MRWKAVLNACIVQYQQSGLAEAAGNVLPIHICIFEMAVDVSAISGADRYHVQYKVVS